MTLTRCVRRRDEAEALPAVLMSARVAKASSRPLSSTQPDFDECLQPPPGLEVEAEWADNFMATFADVRQSLRRWAARAGREPQLLSRRLPALKDAQAWQRLCGWDAAPSGGQPEMCVLVALQPVDVQTLVQYHAEWLEAAWELDGRDALRGVRGAWLFALLARLDADMLADTAARLRQIFRVLTRVRARHSRAEAASESAAQTGMLILIVARYFRQAAPGEC
jgi:hypothetical protein